MRRRIWALGVVVLLVLVGACSSGGHRPDPSTSSSVAAPTTSTAPVAPNPYVVPPVITPAYVDAVFKVLNHINGNAVRALVASGAMTPEVYSELQAIYSDPLYPVEVRVFEAGLTESRSNLKPTLGDRQTTVLKVLAETPTCIGVSTRTSLQEVEIHPTAVAAAEYWSLRRKTNIDDPARLNPTPWVLNFNQDFQVPTPPPTLCSA